MKRTTCGHKWTCRLRFWATRNTIRAMIWLTNKLLLHVIPRLHPSAILLRGNLAMAQKSWATALSGSAARAKFDPYTIAAYTIAKPRQGCPELAALRAICVSCSYNCDLRIY